MYDIIIIADVLEHLKEPMKTVKMLYSRLKKNGIMLTTGLRFAINKNLPMHLAENRGYYEEYTAYMKARFLLHFFHGTANETIYALMKK